MEVTRPSQLPTLVISEFALSGTRPSALLAHCHLCHYTATSGFSGSCLSRRMRQTGRSCLTPWFADGGALILSHSMESCGELCYQAVWPSYFLGLLVNMD